MRSVSQLLGAFVLTLASIILISGIWCLFLSPIMDYTQYVTSLQYSPLIEGFESEAITFQAEKGERIEISIRPIGYPYPPPPPILDPRFNVKVLDPDGKLIWQELNVTGSHIRVEALKSGIYKVEISNLCSQSVSIPIYISRIMKMTVRPLEPAGQWLILISIPIYCFGIWAFITERKKTKQE